MPCGSKMFFRKRPCSTWMAAKWTREHQEMMKPYGGSSGGYFVIEWDSTDVTILGLDLQNRKRLTAA